MAHRTRYRDTASNIKVLLRQQTSMTLNDRWAMFLGPVITILLVLELKFISEQCQVVFSYELVYQVSQDNEDASTPSTPCSITTPSSS